MKKIIRITESELKEIINDKLAQAYGGNPRPYPSGEQWTMGEQQNDSGPDQEILKQLKLKGKMEDWFIINISNKMIKKPNPKYPYSIFYVDKNTGYIYMEYNKKNGYLGVDYDKIFSYFEANYSDNYVEIKELIKGLVGEDLNLWDVAPVETNWKENETSEARWKNI